MKNLEKTLTTPWSKCWRFSMKIDIQQIIYFSIAHNTMNKIIKVNFEKFEEKDKKAGDDEVSRWAREIDFTITWWILRIFRHFNMHYVETTILHSDMLMRFKNTFECLMIYDILSTLEWIGKTVKMRIKKVDFVKTN